MLKNMKIQARLIVSYLVIIALLLVCGITSIVMINQVGDSMTSFYDHQFHTVDNAWSARRSVFSARANMLQCIIATSEADVESTITAAREDFASIRESVKLTQGTYQGNDTYLADCLTLLDKAEPYIDEIERYCSLLTQEGNDTAMGILMNDYKPLMDQLRDDLTKVGETADANALDRVNDAQVLTTTSVIIIIVICVVSVILSIVLAIVISHGIRTPIMEMRKASEDIVAGHLNTAIEYQAKDELGELADNMRGLIDSFRSIIGDISYVMGALAKGNFCVESRAQSVYRGDYSAILTSCNTLRSTMSDTLSQIDVSAAQVNSGSEQVSSGAQALAQGATEQASSVEELAATISEISDHVKTTAEHARTAEEADIHANEEIQQCNEHMTNLVQAMRLIEKKSNEVSNVVQTIEDISFQTNILALNAAVEAARAGSAGKGFAVVAEEVRSLASKSADAAKNSTALIQEALQAVGEGTRITGDTENSLNQVVENSQAVLDAVGKITKATAEQSQAIAQVSQGIDQISSVVQTNSATAEQSAAASEELTGQANMLKHLVDKFQLPHRNG